MQLHSALSPCSLVNRAVFIEECLQARPVEPTLKGALLGLSLCCHRLEKHNNFGQAALCFHFALDSKKAVLFNSFKGFHGIIPP